MEINDYLNLDAKINNLQLEPGSRSDDAIIFLKNLTISYSKELPNEIGGYCCKTNDDTYVMVLNNVMTPRETVLVFNDLFRKMVVEKKEIAINNKTALAGTSTV